MNKELGNKKYYYLCECGSELIQLDVEKDEKWGKEVNFAIFQYGKSGFGWVTKLKWIWKIIKTGIPYSDQVILSFETAGRLARDILEEVEGQVCISNKKVGEKEEKMSNMSDKEKLSLLTSFVLAFIPQFLKKDPNINIKMLAENFAPSIWKILKEKDA